MKLNEQEFYNLMKNYLGYGNPNAKYWFVGKEENWRDINEKITGGIIELKDEDLNYYSNPVSNYSDYILYTFECRLKSQYRTFEKGVVKVYQRLTKNDNISDLLHNCFIWNINFLPLTKDLYSCYQKDKYLYDISTRIKEIGKFLGTGKNVFLFLYKDWYLNMANNLISDKSNKLIWNDEEIKVTIENNDYYILYHPSSRGGKFLNRLNKIIF